MITNTGAKLRLIQNSLTFDERKLLAAKQNKDIRI